VCTSESQKPQKQRRAGPRPRQQGGAARFGWPASLRTAAVAAALAEPATYLGAGVRRAGLGLHLLHDRSATKKERTARGAKGPLRASCFGACFPKMCRRPSKPSGGWANQCKIAFARETFADDRAHEAPEVTCSFQTANWCCLRHRIVVVRVVESCRPQDTSKLESKHANLKAI